MYLGVCVCVCVRQRATEEKNPQSNVREVCNEKEGADRNGVISLANTLVLLRAPVARSPSLSSPLHRTAVPREVRRVLLAV